MHMKIFNAHLLQKCREIPPKQPVLTAKHLCIKLAQRLLIIIITERKSGSVKDDFIRANFL